MNIEKVKVCEFCKVIEWEDDTTCQCYRDGYIDGSQWAMSQLINELPMKEIVETMDKTGVKPSKIIAEIKRIAEIISSEKKRGKANG